MRRRKYTKTDGHGIAGSNVKFAKGKTSTVVRRGGRSIRLYKAGSRGARGVTSGAYLG